MEKNTKTNKKISKTKIIKTPKSSVKVNEVNNKVTKDKALAIFLAITAGPLAWIYTYREDRVKFWINIIAIILLFWTILIPLASYIFAIVDIASKNNKNSIFNWVY